jgi:hypothetical protein
MAECTKWPVQPNYCSLSITLEQLHCSRNYILTEGINGFLLAIHLVAPGDLGRGRKTQADYRDSDSR